MCKSELLLSDENGDVNVRWASTISFNLRKTSRIVDRRKGTGYLSMNSNKSVDAETVVIFN